MAGAPFKKETIIDIGGRATRHRILGLRPD